jgi:hypothetical protein
MQTKNRPPYGSGKDWLGMDKDAPLIQRIIVVIIGGGGLLFIGGIIAVALFENTQNKDFTKTVTPAPTATIPLFVPPAPTTAPIPTQAPARPSASELSARGELTIHAPGCDVKGNVGFNDGTKIYHIPGGKFYDATTIDPRYGERWFCTEEDAVNNGWRKSSQ